MGMFRSETMKHGTLVLPADGAREFIELLGMKAHLQFVDMNAQSMQRQYKRYIQRIDEMERILRFLFEEINKLPGTRVVKGGIDGFLASDFGYQLDSVEDALQKVYTHFQNFRENNLEIVAQKNAAIEEYAVTKVAMASLGPSSGSRGLSDRRSSEMRDADSAAMAAAGGGVFSSATAAPGTAGGAGVTGFTNIAGVLASDDQEKLARTLFRATRGNAFSHFELIDNRIMDLKTNKLVQKSVFVAYFQSGTSMHSALKDKITRICQAYNVNIYDWPKSASEASEKLTRLEERIEERTRALEASENFYIAESAALLEVHRENGGSLIEDYRLFCLKEKALYSTLNMFEGVDVTLRADCWFPAAEEDDIRRLLITNSRQGQASAFLLTDRSAPRAGGCNVSPPTYIRTTEFTAVFQSVVDTYGVPRYQEANPALVTIITFPFLFGIMYGDIGHGACVLAFGLYLVFAWKQISKMKDEMVQMIGGGRYLITLMGLFAVYAGFIYNDFFSLGLNIFGSRYVFDRKSGDDIHQKFDRSRLPYPFGLDPAWKGSANELLYTNSFKMKFAVIVGFCQMILGVIFKGTNCLHFKDYLGFFFEFIPQFIFMLGLVGFMDGMIFYKWASDTKPNFFNNNDNKPSIINNIIEMCMFQDPTHIAFTAQPKVMRVSIVLMVIALPTMLLVKPLSNKAIYDRKKKRYAALDHSEDPGKLEAGQIEGSGVEEEFDFGEEMIHQLIETIEFVLSTISNTASYLRLWALSLAHQQLSLVFFNMTIKLVLQMDMSAFVVGIILFFIFAIFAAITFGVLLCMDTLECFLHALRLQWVEFQNKFYKADGCFFFLCAFTFFLNMDLYEILGVENKNASQKEITKAYRLKALQLHPDKRLNGKEEATSDFQTLNKAYDILKDPEKRELYNQTGIIDEDDNLTEESIKRFKSIFRKVTKQDIDHFAKSYKQSTEEKEDLIDFYQRFEGDVSKLLEYIPLSEAEDIPRFIQLLDELIKAKTLPRRKGYKKACEKLREEAIKYEKQRTKESKELHEKDDDSMDALVLALQKNRRRREQESALFLDNLAAKYQDDRKSRRKR